MAAETGGGGSLYSAQRFVSGVTTPATTGGSLRDDVDLPLWKTTHGRSALTGIAILVAAATCFVAGHVGGPSTPGATPAQIARAKSLRADIHAARARSQGLPSAPDAARDLTSAAAAATSVAQLQNDYRAQTPQIGASDGALDASGHAVVAKLRPYFDRNVPVTSLHPWFLLASDRLASVGIGIPQDFQSGFHWVALRPRLVDDRGMVPVTWLAVPGPAEAPKTPVARAGSAQDSATPAVTGPVVDTGTVSTGTAVLAVARASYDPVNQVLTHLRVEASSTGAPLRLEVTR